MAESSATPAHRKIHPKLEKRVRLGMCQAWMQWAVFIIISAKIGFAYWSPRFIDVCGKTI
ncbi:hypothetical protein [Prosthecobacter debontii]|uniref:hypothetical protein n=1 Tax=Prosthecobacter debontii TaxID=48467 RepID=UPI001FE6F80F|nr:hypothetical protein [Prosthecobacter debontii]